MQQFINNNERTGAMCICIFIHTVQYLHESDACIQCCSGNFGMIGILLIKWLCLTIKSGIIRLIDWWWVYMCIFFRYVCMCELDASDSLTRVLIWIHITGSFYWIIWALNRYQLHVPCRSINYRTQGTARVLCLLRITLLKHCYELSLVYTLNKVSR